MASCSFLVNRVDFLFRHYEPSVSFIFGSLIAGLFGLLTFPLGESGSGAMRVLSLRARWPLLAIALRVQWIWDEIAGAVPDSGMASRLIWTIRQLSRFYTLCILTVSQFGLNSGRLTYEQGEVLATVIFVWNSVFCLSFSGSLGKYYFFLRFNMAAGLFCFCSSTFQFGTVSYFGPVDSKLPFFGKNCVFHCFCDIWRGCEFAPLFFSLYLELFIWPPAIWVLGFMGMAVFWFSTPPLVSNHGIFLLLGYYDVLSEFAECWKGQCLSK